MEQVEEQEENGMKINSEEYSIIMDACNEAFGRRVRVYDMRKTEKGIEFGVNWSAVGTVSAEETREFATKMMNAANVVTELNRAYLRVRYVEDETLTEDEMKYLRTMRTRMTEGFKCGYINALHEFLSECHKKHR